MAREEELVLLKAENEQLEQQLAAFGEKVGKGLGRDGVLESLQFALRKARCERDAEVREADGLFNQLQEAKAAMEELRELRAAFVTALASLSDDWSVIPLISEDARELRARADAAVRDPTNLSPQEMTTLLRGLLVLASRGLELQREVQTLRGEREGLQAALDAAQQQLADQAEQLNAASGQAIALRSPRHRSPSPAARGSSDVELSRRSAMQREADLEQQRRHEEVVGLLRRQVSELESKLAEYRSYLMDNHEEIEHLQNDLRRLRQEKHASSGQPVDAAAVIHTVSQASQPPKPAASAVQGTMSGIRGALFPTSSAAGVSNGAVSGIAGAVAAGDAVQRRQLKPQPQAVQAAGTPTRHMPSSSSPISTVNYGASPPPNYSPPARSSPSHSAQPVADIAQKVVELQELALRAQQQAAERETEVLQQHDRELSALREDLTQQKTAELAALAMRLSQQHAKALEEASQKHAAALAHAEARLAELAAQHARKLAEAQALQAELAQRQTSGRQEWHAERAHLAEMHSQTESDLRAQLAALAAKHSEELAAREEQLAERLQAQLQEREAELQRLHDDALGQQAARAEELRIQALADQAARLTEEHAKALSRLEVRWQQERSSGEQAREEHLEKQFAERLARREEEMRAKHAERLAEQAAELALMHAEQAAALGVQHAEELADKEASMRQEMERRLPELEAQLAAANDERGREVEAQGADRVHAAVEEREACLKQMHAKELSEALKQQAERLAAEADMELRRLQACHADEMARLAERHHDDLQQRAVDMEQRLEEERLRSRELELQLQEALAVKVDRLVAVEAVESSDEMSEMLSRQLADMEDQLASQKQLVEQLTAQCDEAHAALERAHRQRAEAVMAVERQCVEVVAKLGRDHEQATAEARTVHELREANLRRALDRQAEQTTEAQNKQNERLREMQGRVAELQALLRKDRDQRASTDGALEALVDKLAADLGIARRDTAQAQGAQAATHRGHPFGARHRMPDADAQSLPSSLDRPALSAMPTGDQDSDEDADTPELLPSESPSRDSAARTSPRLDLLGDSVQEPPGPSPPAKSTPGPAVDLWHDGQALVWPEHVLTGNLPGAEGHSGAGKGADSVGPEAAAAATRTPSSHGSFAPPEAREPDAEAGRSSEHDLAANLVRALRGDFNEAATGGASAAGSRPWNASLESNGRKSPRRGLLHSLQVSVTSLPAPIQPAPWDEAPIPSLGAQPSPTRQADPLPMSASVPPFVSPIASRSTACEGGPEPALTPTNSAAVPSLFGHDRTPSPAAPSPAPPEAVQSESARAVAAATADDEDEWGELVSAPAPPADGERPGAVGLAEGLGSLISGPLDSSLLPTPDPAYMSGAATSVSTTSSYNSDTEFYVDDEDDEELRGRALAAALAQSPRTSQSAVFPLPPPPALVEIQRRRSQSPGPSSPSGAATESPTWSGSDAASALMVDVSPGVSSGRLRPRSNVAAEGDVRSGEAGGNFAEVIALGPLPSFSGSTQPGHADARNHELDEREQSVDGAFGARAMAPAGEPRKARMASGAIDLEATLSSPFPVLFMPPLTAATEPHESAGCGEPTAPHAEAATTQPPALLHMGSFAFTQSSLDTRTSKPGEPLSDSEASSSDSDGRGTAGAADGRGDSPNQLEQVPDLSGSFDFSSGGRLWARAAPTMLTTWTEATPSTTLGPSPDRSLTSTAAVGGTEEPNAGADGGTVATSWADGAEGAGGSISFESSTSPDSVSPVSSPSRARPRNGVDAYPEERPSSRGPAASSSPLSFGSSADTPLHGGRAYWSSEDIAAAYSPESSVSPGEDGDGGQTLLGFGLSRSVRATPKGVVPLMAPNPLFEDTGEPSPPWSTAEWSTPREGAAAGETGQSLPSTPRGSASGASSSCSDGCRSDRGSGDGKVGYTAQHRAGREDASFIDATTPVGTDLGGSAGTSVRSHGGHASGTTLEHHHQQAPSNRLGGSAAWDGPRDTDGAADASVVDGAGSSAICAPAGDEDDDMRSLLAAGASLGSSERRRRQRRRMGVEAAAAPLNHPVDLLRQSWEFSGGVATPISPRSPRLRGLRLPPMEATSEGPQQSPARREDVNLLPLRTLAQVMESIGPISPRAARTPRGSVLLDASLPAPRAQAPGSRVSSPNPTSATPGSPAASPSPRTDAPGSRHDLAPSADALGAGTGEQGSEAGPLSLVLSPGSTASTPGLSISANEARQRSRLLLGRAMSRVAELEDQCRALATVLPAGVDATSSEGTPSAFGTPAAAASTSSSLRPASAASGVSLPPAIGQEKKKQGELGQTPDASPGLLVQAAAAGGASPWSSPAAPIGPLFGGSNSALSSPAVAAEVIVALEDLRGDLHELEQLHLATTGGGLTPWQAPASPIPAVMAGPGPAEQDGSEAQLLLPPASSSTAGSPSSSGGVTPTFRPDGQAGDLELLRIANAFRGDYHHFDIAGAQSGHLPVEGTVPNARVAAAGDSMPAVPQDAAVSGRVSAAAFPLSSSHDGPPAGLAPASPGEPNGSPLRVSLDPTLVSLLQVSIQAQLQGQLGQLEAKIAELQRQNEALLAAAANAASTPATPLLPSGLTSRGAAAAASIGTPLPMRPLSDQMGAPAAGAAENRESVTPPNLLGGSLAVGGGSLPACMGSAALRGRDAAKLAGAATDIFVGENSEPVHVSMSVYPSAMLAMPRVVSPGHAQCGPAAAAEDAVAGPYSPEQLSQLPPTVQLYAPPQLRAAALAAAHVQPRRMT